MAEYGKSKVETTELVAKAEDAFARIEDCRSSLEHINSLIRSTDGFWKGEAGDLARSKYEEESKQALAALEYLSEYPKDLLKYNDLYSSVIESVTREVGSVATINLQ